MRSASGGFGLVSAGRAFFSGRLAAGFASGSVDAGSESGSGAGSTTGGGAGGGTGAGSGEGVCAIAGALLSANARTPTPIAHLPLNNTYPSPNARVSSIASGTPAWFNR
jgi:hypothetical protein